MGHLCCENWSKNVYLLLLRRMLRLIWMLYGTYVASKRWFDKFAQIGLWKKSATECPSVQEGGGGAQSTLGQCPNDCPTFEKVPLWGPGVRSNMCLRICLHFNMQRSMCTSIWVPLWSSMCSTMYSSLCNLICTSLHTRRTSLSVRITYKNGDHAETGKIWKNQFSLRKWTTTNQTAPRLMRPHASEVEVARTFFIHYLGCSSHFSRGVRLFPPEKDQSSAFCRNHQAFVNILPDISWGLQIIYFSTEFKTSVVGSIACSSAIHAIYNHSPSVGININKWLGGGLLLVHQVCADQ